MLLAWILEGPSARPQWAPLLRAWAGGRGHRAGHGGGGLLSVRFPVLLSFPLLQADAQAERMDPQSPQLHTPHPASPGWVAVGRVRVLLGGVHGAGVGHLQTFPPLLPPHPGYEPTGPRDVWPVPVVCFAVGGPAYVVALQIPPPTPVSPKSIKTDRTVGSGELEGGMRGGRARVEGAGCLPREGNQGGRSTAVRLGPSLPELPHTSTRWAKDFLSSLSKVLARVSPAGQQGHHLGSACMWLWGPGREWAHLLLAAGVGGGEGCLQASRAGLGCAQGQLESWAVFCPLRSFPCFLGPWTDSARPVFAGKGSPASVSKAEGGAPGQ